MTDHDDSSTNSVVDRKDLPVAQKKLSEKKLSEGFEHSTTMDTILPNGEPRPVQSNVNALSSSKEHSTEAPLDRVTSQAQKLGKQKVITIMFALCLATFLAALDMTIIGTALPTMAAQFHATQSGYSWMASSYLLANAACTPVWGKISDIWGRKPIQLLAIFVFLSGSLICALAVSLSMILAGRAIQGVGAGGILVLSYICVGDLFSPRERPLYYGLFGATWAVAGGLGPILGGAFTTDVTWRWCFYLNLPIAGFSFTILLLFLRIDTPKTPLLAGLRAIDWIGTVTSVGGTLMFLFGLGFGGITFPWNSPTVICLLIFGPVVMVIFMFTEWKLAKYPIIPIRLFQDWHNVGVYLICFCHGFAFISGTFYLPLYFQTVLLASPILSGAYLLPQVGALAIMSASVGAIISKTGNYKEPIVIGMGLMTLGFGLFINLQPYASWPRIIMFQLIAGIGVGPNFQAPLVAIQANIRPSDVAAATATFTFTRQLSAAVSVVLGTVVFQNTFAQQMPSLVASLGPETASHLASSFVGSDRSFLESLPADQREVVLGAYTYALSRSWILYAAVAGIGFITSLFLRRVELSRSHQVTKTGLDEQERVRQERLAEKAAHAKRTSSSSPQPVEV